MSELFSERWMDNFLAQWNADDELVESLQEIKFGSNIGYGIEDEDDPRVVLTVENGIATSASIFKGQPLNWDIRCSEAQWKKWISNPPGVMAIGFAFTSGKVKFKIGDYESMLNDPRMAAPFIRHFAVMGRA
ncbi:MAG: SCP-2 sterol transfer family protein [Gammaproteobacteria bacterium]|nr:SCP-2 sterol transfer family protein [Gammaproteobacteria bacterium]